MSCTSSHKVISKARNKTDSTDHSIVSGITHTNIIASEKADTTILIKPDTASLKIFVPEILEDSDTSVEVQRIETDHLKISINAKPVFQSGKKIGTSFTTIAIKKPDSVKVNVEKTTITNTDAQTKDQKDIAVKKTDTSLNKDVKKKGMSFLSTLFLWLIIIALLVVAYFWLKKQYKI